MWGRILLIGVYARKPRIYVREITWGIQWHWKERFEFATISHPFHTSANLLSFT